MIDNGIQIQALKSQIENMKLQIENIEMQNNSMMMNISPLGDQILNLSIQLLNAGIQAFNSGKNMFMGNMQLEKYYKQLKSISTTINSLISDYETNPMMQQQMMQQQMAQQMQQQMMDEQYKYKEITFKHVDGNRKIIKIKIGSTVKELINKHKKEIYSLSNKTLTFLYNAVKISENDNRKVEDIFKFNNTKNIF